MRDTSRALTLVEEIRPGVTDDGARPAQALAELKVLLTDMDARTGKRDPSKRVAKKLAKKKAAKRGATHPGSASHVDGNEPSRPHPKAVRT